MRRIIKLPVFYLGIAPTIIFILYLGASRDTLTDRLYTGGDYKMPAIKGDIRMKTYEAATETPDTHTPVHTTPGGANDSTEDVTATPSSSSSSPPPPSHLALNGKEMEEEKDKEKKSEMKFILVWNNGYGLNTMGFGEGRQPFVDGGCGVNDCYLTGDRSYLPVTAYDAIIFHLRPTTIEDLPDVRSPKQRWIMWEVESASYLYQDLTPYAGLFNWTMTYRLDSDIPQRYGRVIPIEPSSSASSPSFSFSSVPSRNYAKGKTKLVAWFASNCLTHSRREKIVQFMRDLSMEVDVYGKCGKLKCPRVKEQECRGLLDKHYKFYLSFENSLCNDYVTEKLFAILKHDVVPVVFGSANYTKLAPPNSFINMLDFSSVKGLVDYLKYLDKNDEAYNRYFRWKGHYKVMDGWHETKEAFCTLCKKLHEDKTPKVYEDIKMWFAGQGGCKRVRGMPLHSLSFRDPVLKKYEILIQDHKFETFLNVTSP